MNLDEIICIEMPLSATQRQAADRQALQVNPANYVSEGSPPKRLWRPGSLLRVRFLDGEPRMWHRVEEIAREWTQYANIAFTFGDDPEAEIRVTFVSEGLWSYIGTDALAVPRDQPTLSLGPLPWDVSNSVLRRVVLHEFGHVLGLEHEHQTPTPSLPWDRERVFAYCMGAPYFLTREQVEFNIFQHYSARTPQFSHFDPNSIMLFAIPDTFTMGDFEIGWNRDLSGADRTFIQTLYPGSSGGLISWGGGQANIGGGRYGSAVPGPVPPVEEGNFSWGGGTVRDSMEEKDLGYTERRLEAAIPQSVSLNIVFTLLVRVSLLDSPPLSREDFPDRFRPSDTYGEDVELTVDFPVDPNTGEVLKAQLAVQIVTDDFDTIGKQQVLIPVPPYANSPVVKFQLRPRHVGSSFLNVEVYDHTELYLGAAPLDTNVVDETGIIPDYKIAALPLRMHVEPGPGYLRPDRYSVPNPEDKGYGKVGEMTLAEVRAQLSGILAGLYITELDAQRIAATAGLNLSRIVFSTAAINRWHGILVEAENTGKSESLLKVVLNPDEYGANQALVESAERYRQVYQGKVVVDTSIDSGRQEPALSLELPLVSAVPILFLAANPVDTDPLQLAEELRGVKDALRPFRDRLEIESEWAVRIKELRRAMLDYNPVIVHFAGHGDSEGLLLQGDDGHRLPVGGEGLRDFFADFPQVECVLFNACYTDALVQVVAEVVPCVIGMQATVKDQASIAFAEAFYDVIGRGYGTPDLSGLYAYAFSVACNSLKLLGKLDAVAPVLRQSG